MNFSFVLLLKTGLGIIDRFGKKYIINLFVIREKREKARFEEFDV